MKYNKQIVDVTLTEINDYFKRRYNSKSYFIYYDFEKFVLLGDEFVRHKEELSTLMWGKPIILTVKWILEHIGNILRKHKINLEDVHYKLDNLNDIEIRRNRYITMKCVLITK